MTEFQCVLGLFHLDRDPIVRLSEMFLYGVFATLSYLERIMGVASNNVLMMMTFNAIKQ